MATDAQEVVLVLLLGTSPAILTETVWALAQQVPAVVPDKLEVWTTTKGREVFEAKVMASGVWTRLVEDLKAQQIPVEGKLKFGEDSWKIFANDELNRLEDLTTEADNLAAADKMLRELRHYTDDPTTKVLLSIAGGRKTMGALALQCMGLVGRPQDEVYHVLVNPPFDNGRLTPPFFYPEKKGRAWMKRLLNGETVTDKDAQVQLFKVPYVRMRPLYEEKMREQAVGFRYLCDRVQARIYREPEVVVDMALTASGGVISVDGKKIRLNTSMVLLWLIWKHKCYKREALETSLKAIKSRTKMSKGWLLSFAESQREFNADEDLTKALSDLKQKVVKVAGKEMGDYFPERFMAPAKTLSNIRWNNTKDAEDALIFALGMGKMSK